MEFEQAMEVLTKVCALFHGNLQDHQTIQQALSVVRSSKCRCKDAKKEVKDAVQKKASA
jgi:hypothetical protein